jgi:hypothetical protein
MMMKTKHLLLLLSVLLLSLVEGSTDIDYSEQRRQLMWGSGGFAWLMCKSESCHPCCRTRTCARLLTRAGPSFYRHHASLWWARTSLSTPSLPHDWTWTPPSATLALHSSFFLNLIRRDDFCGYVLLRV